MDEERMSDWEKIMKEKERAKLEGEEQRNIDEFLAKVEEYGLQNMDDTVNYIRIQIDLTRKLQRQAVVINNTILYMETSGVLATLKGLLDLILLGDEVLNEAEELKPMNKKDEAMNYV